MGDLDIGVIDITFLPHSCFVSLGFVIKLGISCSARNLLISNWLHDSKSSVILMKFHKNLGPGFTICYFYKKYISIMVLGLITRIWIISHLVRLISWCISYVVILVSLSPSVRPRIFFSNNRLDNLPRLSNWFLLWCLGPWTSHLPHVWWSAFRFIILKWHLVCKFGIVERDFLLISSLH